MSAPAPEPESEPERTTGDDDQIDDPIRIYLMQMGEIPLLTRAEELVAAKQIKRARRRFRHIMLATDYVLHSAIDMLKSIRDGRSRLDRTIEVSVINLREKRRLIRVLTPNLHTLSFADETNGRNYSLNDKTAVLMVRPRGWHMREEHVTVDGDPMSASLFDFGLFVFHNAGELLARGSGPYFYLPKLQSRHEAALWREVFVAAEKALDIPRYHHEWWDGSGYPRGLEGENIPLSARIFCIVDVWDAMTSDRVYRKALSEEDVVKYIIESRGTHFDPQVVDAFLAMMGKS